MSAGPQDGDEYIIYNVEDAKALVVPNGASTSPLALEGEPLIVNHLCTRQIWRASIIERESSGTYWVTLTNVASGTVMETETMDDNDDDGEKDGIASGNTVRAAKFREGRRSQQWEFDQVYKDNDQKDRYWPLYRIFSRVPSGGKTKTLQVSMITHSLNTLLSKVWVFIEEDKQKDFAQLWILIKVDKLRD